MLSLMANIADYPRIRRSVVAIDVPNNLDNPESNTDFFVRLHDGRTFLFVAITPENLRLLMDRDQEKSYLIPGMVVVSAITIDCILDAIEHWLPSSESDVGLIEEFGILQVRLEDDEELDDT